MYKKIVLLGILLIVILTGIISVLLFTHQNWNKRNVWLIGCQAQNKKPTDRTEYLHTFFGSQFENYALYSPQTESNSLVNAKFYGNLDNYNNCIKPTTTATLWQNDFTNTQLVIKTNAMDIYNLSAQITNIEELKAKNLEVQFGFNRFIYASNSNTNSGILNPYGINEKLLVPDAITTTSVETIAYSNKVYILWIKLIAQEVVPVGDYQINIELQGQIGQPTAAPLILSTNMINLMVSDLIVPENDVKADFDIYSFFGWTAAYYNNYAVPPGIKDRFDNREYIDYNWSRYWEPEYRYTNNILGMEYFQNPISLNERENKEWHNNWLDGNKVQTFLPWRYDENHQLYIAREDWDNWDYYMNKMADIGFTKALLGGWQAGWNTSWRTNKVWNEKTQDYEAISMNIFNDEGYQNNEWFLQELLKHIKNDEPAWVGKVTPYVYLDELQRGAISEYLNLIKKYDFNRQYIKLAACEFDRAVDYSDPALYDVDILHIFFFDIYNSNNSNFTNLVKIRNEQNYLTGQYFLDADNTFNLIRSEPGVSSYLQLALLKEGAPHYMRYLLNGWVQKNAYWTSDYVENTGIVYISGDTMYAYPSVAYDDITNNFPTPVQFNPSTRLDAIAWGTKLNNKLMYLKKINKISSELYQTLTQYVDQRVKLSKITSHTKFDFNYSNTSLKYNVINSKSFIYQSIAKSGIDEITVVKTISNLVDLYSK
ncbi:hypothetical protein [Spiroplasma chrysopicola]|uniref:Glycoside hydrolase 123 C-terminal domain-containing protein n=1 Tax=Spiroplasma chrysopicola DF-1 TaxID=1276227 RepID=R4UGN9_9MOLU|nr:hypothetical protein [Spiroplasma chrysopicola]AGM25300.1 hypothetical protein SCHRY_v1c07240 [Spiroplasma chrysopicola DF-1]